MRYPGSEHSQALEFLLRKRFFLGSFEIGNIRAGGDIAGECSVLEERNPAADHRSVLAVGAAQPAFQVTILASFIGCGNSLAATFHVFGMYAGGPILAQFLFDSTAGEIQPSLIEKSSLLIRARNYNTHWRCIGHIPEALF